MSEWRNTTIGDLGTVVTGATPPGKHPDWFGDELPFVTPSDMTAGDRRPRPGRWLSESGRNGLRTRVVPSGSCSFVCIGATIGKVCLLDTEAVTNQQINTVVPGPDTDSRFLYSLLRYVAPTVAQGASGAATPIINKTAFSETPVRVPDLATQICIGEDLGGLDDLIENNRRRVQVLEEMARAIYREWFVKFRYPGHEQVPLVDSALGPIPEGWEAVAASTAVQINPTIKLDRSVERPFIAMGDVSETSLVCYPSETRVGGSGARFEDGDTLLARINPSLQNGKTGFVQSLGESVVGLGSTEFIVMRGRSVGRAFTYCLARQDEFRGNAIASMVGASGRQRVRNECFDTYYLAVPPATLADTFEAVAAPLLADIDLLHRQATSLSHARDLLLPKLVTGQIDVSTLNLDRVFEEAIA